MDRMAAFAATLPLTGAFRPVSRVSARPRRHVRAARTARLRATAADTDASVANEAAAVERSFERLRHANPAQRQAAAGRLAEMATRSIVERLIGLLGETDTNHRRAAVQALGMCGECGDAVRAVSAEMEKTADAITRASCAKALAAAALHHPSLRAHFDGDALNALATLAEKGDPVARIAAVGALATLGSDAKEGAGSDIAYARLADMLNGELDAACGAVAVGAVAQIAQNAGEERKMDALKRLKRLAEDSKENDAESGVSYVREMARSHVEQLEVPAAQGAA